MFFFSYDAIEAGFVCEMLMARKIPAFLLNSDICRLDPFKVLALGGVEVCVGKEHIEEAEGLLKFSETPSEKS
ncbi:MAG: hypothetical protein COB53_01820 [Elusimicrobia bacterium]|nr:MAG: hypothetical protein COB53_01820 [Elusimicrobiota bacterium]